MGRDTRAGAKRGGEEENADGHLEREKKKTLLRATRPLQVIHEKKGRTRAKECRETAEQTATDGTITEGISGGEMKDSHYLLLIKRRARDRNRGRETEGEGGGGRGEGRLG